MTEKLGAGAAFPVITLDLVGGGQTTIPADIATPYLVMLFYRGHW